MGVGHEACWEGNTLGRARLTCKLLLFYCVVTSGRYLSTAQLALAGDGDSEHGEQGEAVSVSDAVGRLRQALVRPRRGFHLEFA